MAEPDTAERERKTAWLKTMRDTTKWGRQIEKSVTARISAWKHEIAVRVTVGIGLIAFVVAVASLNGVPLFSAKMTWIVIVIAVLSTLYELWG